jgi:hypothetical protein
MMRANELVWVDDAYDLDYASDGSSRFAAYLRQWSADLDDPELSAASYVATVWRVATGPVMSPGYVQLNPTVWSVMCRPGEDPERLVIEIDVRLDWPQELRGHERLREWSTWSYDRIGDSRVMPPEGAMSFLPSVRLHQPIDPAALPTPSGSADVVAAKRAVVVLCRIVNGIAGPVVAAALDPAGAGARR